MTAKRRATPVLAAAVLALAGTAVAPGAEISDGGRTIVIAYDDALWAAAVHGEEIDFACTKPACGGAAAACNVMVAYPEPDAVNLDAFTVTLRERIAASLAARLPGLDDDREVIEDADKVYKGDVMGVSALIGATVKGVPFRVSYFYIAAPGDALGVVSCIVAEPGLVAGRAAFDTLMSGIAITGKQGGKP